MMKKIIFPLMAFFLMAGLTVQAQMDHKVTTGVVAFNGQDYGKALKALNEALDDPSKLKSKNVPKAYYYRAQTWQRLLMAAAQSGDSTMMMKYKDAFLNSYQDYKKGKETDDGKWGKKIDAQLMSVYPGLLQGGIQAINVIYQNKDLSEAEKKEAGAEASKYLEMASEIRPEDYVPNDLMGQSYMTMKDTAKAKSNFQAAINKFEKNPPKRPDQLVAYIYYRLALIQKYSDNDIKGALENISKGQAALETEHGKMQKSKENYKEDQWASVVKQYSDARDDLSNFELDLLLNAPDMLQSAVTKFEKAIESEPKNYIKHVAFAQLLEKLEAKSGDDNSAKIDEIYTKAIAIDPANHMGHFNLGAYYVNKAVINYKAANEISDDMDKAKSLQDEGDALFRKAEPHLKNAQAQKEGACDAETLRALLQIYINLNMMEEYKKYKDIQKECGL